MTLLRAWTGELEQARNDLAKLGQECLINGEEGELIFVAFQLVLVDIWLGRLDSAASTANETIERAAQLGGDFPLFIALTLRGAVAAYVGRLDDALRDVNGAMAAAQRCGSMRLAEWPVTLAGFIEVSRGDYRAAFNALEPLLPVAQSFPDASEIIASSFVPDLVEAMLSLGRFDDAEPLIESLERNGRRLDRAWTLAVGLRSRAMLQAGRGDVASAVTTAELALTQHQRLSMPFEQARTQLLLARLQRRHRHRDAAAASLQEALLTFERLGATVWVQQAKAEHARGVSGRQGGQGLTATEERVAELAASGITNRDIAGALFVSSKTVEVNLSRIYRKLGIRSRAELYQALQAWRAELDMS